MKAQNLTAADLKGVIFPANMQGDMEKTYKWLEAGKPGRSRAAERVCGLFKQSEPPPAPVVEAAPEVAAPAPVVEAAPSAAAVAPAATVEVSPNGTVTVRPSTLPPAPAAAPEASGDESAAALRAIRKLYNDWKGGQYVCGNAFKRMNQVDEVLKLHGF
jgi:type IV secretory pathway VirB10-like protein